MEMAEKLIKINRPFINRCLAYYTMTEDEIRQEAITTYYLHPEIDVLNRSGEVRKASSLFMACLRRNASANMPFGIAIRDNKSWDSYNNKVTLLEYSFSGIVNSDINELLWKKEFLEEIRDFIGLKEYDNIIEYYEYGSGYIANKLNISEDSARKKASRLIQRIRNKFL